MLVTPERVFYSGLLGTPAVHEKGALSIYVSLDEPLQLRVDGGMWQLAEIGVVQPYVPFQITCRSRHVLNILVEPESIDLLKLPMPLRTSGAVDAPGLIRNARREHLRLVTTPSAAPLETATFDRAFFGEALQERPMDPRIAHIVARMQAYSAGRFSAQDCADICALSVSRFLHLFRREIGAPFRAYRSWKRARSLLYYVRRDGGLLDVALDIGYPDSTHFSHSIRRKFGLRPKDIFAGSRELRLITAERISSVAA